MPVLSIPFHHQFAWPHIFRDGHMYKRSLVHQQSYNHWTSLTTERGSQYEKSMTGDDYVTLTGLRKCYFDDILTYVSSADVWASRSRSIKSCISVLLTKLRTSLDNKPFAVMFNMSTPQVGLTCKQMFIKYYVSKWICNCPVRIWRLMLSKKNE